MAEQTVNHVLAPVSIEERARFNRPQTLAPLNPLVTEELLERALRLVPSWTQEWGLPQSLVTELATRHGLEARRIVQEALPLRATIPDAEEWMWCAEALHAIEHTMCLTLTDFYLRRTHLILAREDHGRPFVAGIARVMGERLGWDAQRRQEQINALQNQLSWELAATISS
jgi:glycerol-3-phosphate dehydrogenase